MMVDDETSEGDGSQNLAPGLGVPTCCQDF